MAALHRCSFTMNYGRHIVHAQKRNAPLALINPKH